MYDPSFSNLYYVVDFLFEKNIKEKKFRKKEEVRKNSTYSNSSDSSSIVQHHGSIPQVDNDETKKEKEMMKDEYEDKSTSSHP